MNILIIGKGGREHAIAWKISKSPLIKKIYVAPGNAGTALEPLIENVNILETDINGLLKFAKKKHIDLTIVGPEYPLVIGIVDIFKEANMTILGPTKKAAQIEGSKSFAKNFLKKYKIPTANYKVFKELKPALNYLDQIKIPIVIKADGLASGKGVIIANNLNFAKNTVKNMLNGNLFGNAGCKIVIEEFLYGEEISFTVIIDGKNMIPIVTCQDHKRIGNNDTGLNTGGMGAYSPVTIVNDTIYKRIMDQIINPTIKGLKEENNNYKGFLYAGLIIDKLGNPKVIEFNCRLGDPETQTIIMRLKSDLVELCLSCINSDLINNPLLWDKRFSLSVVISSIGYPEYYKKGDIIHNLPIKETSDFKIFHSGTKINNNKIVTSGGRVLCVTALGYDIIQAKEKAYEIIKKIKWENSYYRNDIGFHAI
ncbi:phosphoribosylamine--glycine ligase [Candidatus Providencia siddallii]|uniref:Phosphoribosylamine--glycine ligase n=1 Tax=Candidatus Providencia siddallii TaxID=1715285 RepID=A0ABP1CG39_9GAMM